ncbi:MAG TPA: cation:proton antiporter [Candidatus Eisenbacteria bacterium]
MSGELTYVLLVFALFVVPKVILRFRIPTAITELGLGAAAGVGLGLFHGDTTIALLSSFGIIALFLLAGLDVDVRALARDRFVLLQHLAIRSVLVAAGTWAAMSVAQIGWRPACLVSLALLTPSTGFILSTLRSTGMTESEAAWVKAKAIATELLALLILFGVTQSTSPLRFGLATAALAALIFILPIAFRVFAAGVAPAAPGSEFAFLVMMAILCGYATRALGVYYLVGAFVVGWAAGRFRDQYPAVGSDRMFHAVEVFASFFIPFYFFSAGLHLRTHDLTLRALAVGAIFVLVAVPVRLATVTLHRRIALGEPFRHGLRIALSMTPTLVFCLVLAEIARDRYDLPPRLFGGLVIYALVTTLAPVVALGIRPPSADTLGGGGAEVRVDAAPAGER